MKLIENTGEQMKQMQNEQNSFEVNSIKKDLEEFEGF